MAIDTLSQTSKSLSGKYLTTWSVTPPCNNWQSPRPEA